MTTNGTTARATRILLKARPTPEQLADRLRAPTPEGLELYLDRVDLAENPEALARRCKSAVSARFSWIVEAPIRTLGGQYFDLTNDDDDHRETLRRVAAVGQALGAQAANVHVVGPTLDASDLTLDERARRLDQCKPLLKEYVRLCLGANLVPQVENIPPVGRMRESAYVYSAIGADPADLLRLVDVEPAIRFTVDVSHAGLYLNWCRHDVTDDRFAPVAAFLRRSYAGDDLGSFCAKLAPFTTTVHVSNASGLLGEGNRYDAGDFDLDAALRPLVGRVPFFVTETLEADANRADGMREAQDHLCRLVTAESGDLRGGSLGVVP